MAGMAGWMVFHETMKVARYEGKAISTGTETGGSVVALEEDNCV